MPEYPNECVRCGFCCLAETCPVGQSIYEVGKYQRCPSLKFDGDVAVCGVMEILDDWGIPKADAERTMGIGAGCCIAARCFKDGVQYDFASLPKEVKIHVVRGMRG